MHALLWGDEELTLGDGSKVPTLLINQQRGIGKIGRFNALYQECIVNQAPPRPGVPGRKITNACFAYSVKDAFYGKGLGQLNIELDSVWCVVQLYIDIRVYILQLFDKCFRV